MGDGRRGRLLHFHPEPYPVPFDEDIVSLLGPIEDLAESCPRFRNPERLHMYIVHAR